ncbi:hypothetical protein [Nonomuraea sp. 10N515B]|uniref:hypothetical protein n=1 Tax=Nonomuraea sp. 10N515B TaxID=3457422 RepID=UPI003FCD7691
MPRASPLTVEAIVCTAEAANNGVNSPLAETTAGLLTLAKGVAAHPGERAWLDAHLPAYQRRLSADPVSALLVRAALGHRWIADFLVPTPAGDGEATFEDEPEHIRTTPSKIVHTDLTVSLGGPLPAALDRTDLAERAADLLAWVWRQAISPYWPRHWMTCDRGCAGWARAGCRSTHTTTRPGSCPVLSCCSCR